MTAGGLVLAPATSGASVVVTTDGLALTSHGVMTAKTPLKTGSMMAGTSSNC